MSPAAVPGRFSWDLFECPVGNIIAVMDASGAVVRVEFLTRAKADKVLSAFGDGAVLKRDARALAPLRRQFSEYFAGRRKKFEMSLAPHGTTFQLSVWRALKKIPYGQTRTYAELAAALGRPEAFRAVGTANGANPLPVLVPCHRVVGSDGSLHGYAAGLSVKSFLLKLEGAIS
jgi:methylated-DNA-[protein]-cysteine S-methyltransferase